MSQLAGKSSQEPSAATAMLHILACTKEKSAAEVAAEAGTDAAKINGQTVLYAVRGAHTVGLSQNHRA